MALKDKLVNLEDLKVVGDVVGNLKSAYDSHSNTAEIRHKSYDFKVNRYNNITYYDRMLYSTLARGTSTEIGVNTDYTWQGRPYSIYFKTDPTKTSSECRINYTTAFKLLGTQEIDIAVYVPDATKVTNIRVSVPSSDFVKSSNNMSQTIVNGWNFIRLMSEGAGSWNENTDNTQIRVLANHSSGAEETIYIGYLMQVVPNYANLILIADGPYYTFFTEAYPALKTMRVPVTWAIDPGLITDSTSSDRQLINNTDLETLANDGISEFSFHSFDGTVMTNATASEALADTLKSIRYLKQHGLEPERMFRAAWLQNSCANPGLANLEVDASASYNGANGVTIYPFMNKYNIPRIGLANRATSYIDELFNKMRMQHCTILAYFHGISTDSETEVTPTMLTYILNSIQTALTAGYLNPTTYNRLVSYYSKIE